MTSYKVISTILIWNLTLQLAHAEFSMSPSPEVKKEVKTKEEEQPKKKKKSFFFNWFKRSPKSEATPPPHSEEPQPNAIKKEFPQTTTKSPGPLELDIIGLPQTPSKSINEIENLEPEQEKLPYHYRNKTPAEIKAKSQPDYLHSNSLEYRLKPGDKIEISVWGEDMTKELMVRPDGMISYILIDEIKVVGKTFKELKLAIQEKLSRYIIDPKVSIIGKSFEGNFVSILGAVANPGRKVVSNSDHVLDVLAKAGGLKFIEFGNSRKVGEIANLKNAYLSRNGELVDVDFSKLLYEGNMGENIPVQIGDFIYIPSSVDMPVYVTGEFFTPTSLPFAGKPTLLEAVSEGGGFNTKANKKQLKIIRGGLVQPEIISYSYYDIVAGKINNPYLEPGDIIYVPPTTLTKIERLSSQVIPFLDSIIKTGSSKDTIRDW